MNTTTLRRAHSLIKALTYFFPHLSAFLLAAFLPLASRADTEGFYSYTVADGKVTLTGYSGPGGDISIPAALGSYPVTCIGYKAFRNCTSLTSVTIPDSVTSIGYFAFSSCTSLTSVTFGNSVTSIGEYAFFNCTGLTSVTIPGSVTDIQEGAFLGCASLTSINVSENSPTYASLGGVLFNKTLSQLFLFPNGRTGPFAIPDSVISIGEEAFFCCSNLTSVTFGSNVTTIGFGAFYGCSTLLSITVPASVTSIDHRAFANCFALTSVVIGNSVTNIGSSAFLGCDSLTSIFYTGDAPLIEPDAFRSLTTTIYFLPSTTGWGDTFAGRPTALWLPKALHNDAFGFCDGTFGFAVSWAAGRTVIVEATTNLVFGAWAPVTTNELDPSGTLDFTDPASTSHASRFYRLTFPQ